MNIATAGFYDFENHTNRGGLPCTIRAKKTIDRSFWNRETYIIHGGEITVGFRDIVQAKNRGEAQFQIGAGNEAVWQNRPSIEARKKIRASMSETPRRWKICCLVRTSAKADVGGQGTVI